MDIYTYIKHSNKNYIFKMLFMFMMVRIKLDEMNLRHKIGNSFYLLRLYIYINGK